MTTATFTLASNTFHVPTDRLQAFASAVRPVLEGFVVTATRNYQDESLSWEGAKVSTGFPPIDGVVSFVTSSKFEATLITYFELVAYAAMSALYLIVQISAMVWEASAEKRQVAFKAVDESQEVTAVKTKIADFKQASQARYVAVKTEATGFVISQLEGTKASTKGFIDSQVDRVKLLGKVA